MRRAARIDANQVQIRNVLAQIGASVQDLSGVGKGCPDLLVGWMGNNYLIEVKDGAKAPSGRKLTDCQKVWHFKWKGQKAVVESVDDVLAVLEGGPA